MSEAKGPGGRRPRIPGATKRRGETSRTATDKPAKAKPIASKAKPSDAKSRVAVGGSARIGAQGREDRTRRPAQSRKGPRLNGTPRAAEPAAPQVEAQPPARASAILIGLVILTVIAFIALGQPVSAWWKQNREYNAVAQQLAEAKAENQRLTGELAKWRSDAFIASQARSRLGYIRPGETQYLVVDLPKNEGENPQNTQPAGPPRPWYLVVAESVQMAGEVPTEQPAPAETGK